MTSASNHPTAALDTVRIDAVAELIAADWGHHGHTALTAMITELYIDLAMLSTHYTASQRAEVIADAADATAGELTTLLDNDIYQEADRPPVTECGWVMHHALTAALASHTAAHLTWWLTNQLNDFITERDAEDAD